LARYRVDAEPAASLAAELAGSRWLRRLRDRSRSKEASFALRDVVRAIDDALFEIATAPGEPRNAQAVIVAVGWAAQVLAARPKLWDRLPPPPLLNAEWVRRAYVDSPEFRIAVVLGWLHARALDRRPRGEGALATGQADAPNSDENWRAILPMRVHFAPVDRERASDWSEGEGGTLAVWRSGALIANLCEVARRRLVEQTRVGYPDKPFSGVIGVGGGDIAAFLDGGTGFDRLVADLLAGLSWVSWPDKEERKRLFEVWRSEPGPLPLTYAALKPLFTPDAVLKEPSLRLPERLRLPIPPALPSLLAVNRVSDALRLGMDRARGSGLPTPFISAQPSSGPNDGRRLLAALTIPVHRGVLRDCISRAYTFEDEPEHAD
ncbi:MAG: type I-U CRISPR-associated protein Csx17, partial [Alphaproteobacteria bacterium]|nr:type I-U CRISPR-associated protein Csx17 [Alphaproteobacteria bacterium]